uniref:peptidylprolyl isomerase n=1 Tax=Neogobius melanostomus TaxID=47308 RepID=A0A8C6TBD3_9GOBI
MIMMRRPFRAASLLALLSLLTLRTFCASAEDAEVKIEVLFKPLECAQKSKKGDLMNVHYDGYLLDGTQFVCSETQLTSHVRSPLWMVVGVGQVIRGLDSGMLDMCPGEKRKITSSGARLKHFYGIS